MEWNYRGSHSRLFSRLRRKIHVADTPMSYFPALIRSFEVKRSKTRHSLSIERHSTCVVTTSNEYRYIKSSIFCRFAGKDSRPIRLFLALLSKSEGSENVPRNSTFDDIYPRQTSQRKRTTRGKKYCRRHKLQQVTLQVTRVRPLSSMCALSALTALAARRNFNDITEAE